jgi:hypothetical protein
MPRETRRSERRFGLIALQNGRVALGWRPGILLVRGTIQDQVQAMSATCGNDKRQEQDDMTSCDRESFMTLVKARSIEKRRSGSGSMYLTVTQLTSEEKKCPKRRVRNLLAPVLGSGILQTLWPASMSSEQASPPLALAALPA